MLRLVVERLIYSSRLKPISWQPVTFGSTGKELTYVVFGDSSMVSEFGTYEKGIAMHTARFLAQEHKVTLYNLSLSGSKLSTFDDQMRYFTIHEISPDIILFWLGANDCIQLGNMQRSKQVIEKFIQDMNQKTQIFIGEIQDFRKIPAFPPVASTLMALRAENLNMFIRKMSEEYCNVHVISWEAVESTVAANPREYFAEDRVHVNDKGYGLAAERVCEVMNGVLAVKDTE